MPLTHETTSEVGAIEGLGVSPGVIEGVARVIVDPATSDPLEPGEILVCSATDPSWVGHFLVAAALVIDVGGPMSHGAIVARELGVPCVINTVVGTSSIRTGDTVRIDGGAGTVEIVARAAA
jgi:pyruvate,water dikinase